MNGQTLIVATDRKCIKGSSGRAWPAHRMTRSIDLLLLPASIFLLLLFVQAASGQGLSPDADGHAARNGKAIMACWNFSAGAGLPESLSRYPEFLPNLSGWDFRINLPHTQFQFARAGTGAAASLMLGVEEVGDPIATETMNSYGHINNSIWLFQTSPSEGRVYAKVLPSRRDLNGRSPQNIESLTGNWFRVGPSNGPTFIVEKLAGAVLGKGLGVARIYLVARDGSGALHMTSHTVSGLEGNGPPVLSTGLIAGGPGGIFNQGWSDAWTPIGVSSSAAPALSETFDGKLALAYIDAAAGDLRVQVYTPSTGTWGPPAILNNARLGRPQLVWDGAALNVFFVGSGTPTLQHAYALSDNPLTFYARSPVSSLIAVLGDFFHAISFNRRLHVVICQDNGTGDGPLFYTTTTTDPGRPASWSIASETGISSTTAPRIAWMYEHILVVGNTADGRIRYSRKDPNRPGNAETGAALADHWLQVASDADPTAGGFFDGLETITFNSDVYLAANKTATSGQPAGLYVSNFSRAVLKQLITDKWGIKFMWGDAGGSTKLNAGSVASNEIPVVADVNKDGRDDIIKFKLRLSIFGPSSVSWFRNLNGDYVSPQVLSADFAQAGDIPMVGDFDGDTNLDLIAFSHHNAFDGENNLLGDAPVWVAPSGFGPAGQVGAPQIWHPSFGNEEEIPFVGDFNGDGKDDMISFSQQPVTDFDGHLVAPCGVWVFLSDGTRFGDRQLWHGDFSYPGEIPMVGDFNADGFDDIVSFVQKPQPGIGTAPVWVSLSNGSSFGPRTVWHTFFAPSPEVPQVGDMNMDGADDILTFLAGKPGAGIHARSCFVAYSVGSKFSRSSLWHSDFVDPSLVRRGPKNRVYSPQIGHMSAVTKGTFSGVPADNKFPVNEIFAFHTSGFMQVKTTMGNIPFPAGAPWERYKFFTDKGIGVALVPEWIYEHTSHCIGSDHRLALLGISGSADGRVTRTSVRFGGRAGHILEELGHSLFSHCFRPESSNPFGLASSIFEVLPANGGMGSNAMLGCPDTVPGCAGGDMLRACRDRDTDAGEEHYFLQLYSRYRLNPECYRQRINENMDAGDQANLIAQYNWLRVNWYEGMEFATGPTVNASLPQPGVPMLPPALPPIIPPDPAPSDTCGACGAGTAMVMPLVPLGMIAMRRGPIRRRRVTPRR
ncbi:MAG TPA: VCBS repeat-containing protein [Phycisphaerae bacterium]|nr:VCBS repeat-containing protein [Phycisphaerae bacterium]